MVLDGRGHLNILSGDFFLYIWYDISRKKKFIYFAKTVNFTQNVFNKTY
jgi:hypothetical protein